MRVDVLNFFKIGPLIILLTDKNFLDLLKNVLDLLKHVIDGMLDGCKGVFNAMTDVGINVRNGLVEVWKHSSVEKFAHLFSVGVILVFIPAIASAMYKVLTKDIPRWLEK
jgi:hypothetical protein